MASLAPAVKGAPQREDGISLRHAVEFAAVKHEQVQGERDKYDAEHQPTLALPRGRPQRLGMQNGLRPEND